MGGAGRDLFGPRAARLALRAICDAEVGLRRPDPAQWDGSPQPKEPAVDPNQAIQKHAEWKLWFRLAVSANEPLDPRVIAKDNQCELGKWLYGEAQALYRRRKAHAHCLAHHAAFHVEAGKVAAVLNAQCRNEAEHMLINGSPFAEASTALILALIELEGVSAADRQAPSKVLISVP